MICPTRARDPLRASIRFRLYLRRPMDSCRKRWAPRGREAPVRRLRGTGKPELVMRLSLSTSATTMPERSARSDTMSWANHCPNVSLHESAAFEGIEHARTERRLHSHVRGSERQRDGRRGCWPVTESVTERSRRQQLRRRARRPSRQCMCMGPAREPTPAGDRLATACCHGIRVRSSRRRRAVRDPRSGGGPPTRVGSASLGSPGLAGGRP